MYTIIHVIERVPMEVRILMTPPPMASGAVGRRRARVALEAAHEGRAVPAVAKAVQLDQNMQIGPGVPVGIRLEKPEVDSISGPT